MDDHAKAVADRWAKKRAEAIAAGKSKEEFDQDMLAFLFYGGWSIDNAHAILKRAQRKSETEE